MHPSTPVSRTPPPFTPHISPQVVFSFVWEVAVFRHSLEPSSLTGGVLIICGVLLLTTKPAQRAVMEKLSTMHRQVSKRMHLTGRDPDCPAWTPPVPPAGLKLSIDEGGGSSGDLEEPLLLQPGKD
jgi:hypothetical protein